MQATNATAVLLGLLLAGCFSAGAKRPPLPTIAGPESPAISTLAGGTLIWSGSDIHARDLRSGREWVLRERDEWVRGPARAVLRMTGPDRFGYYAAFEDVERSAFGLDALARDHHVLARRSMDGRESEDVFERDESSTCFVKSPYLGLPTAGSEVQYTTHNSPLVGAKPMGTVKLAQIDTGKFVTLVLAIDPRREVDWGPGIGGAISE